MNRDRHSKRSETSRKPLSAAQIAVRLLVLCIVVGLLGVSGALLIRTFNQSGQTASVPLDLPIVQAAQQKDFLSDVARPILDDRRPH